MDLEQMLSDAAERVKRMTPEAIAAMYRAQRDSFVRAEAGFGSDEDESAYAKAVAEANSQEIARLEREASERVEAVNRSLTPTTPQKPGDG